jgi:hypothetical protein
MKLFFQQILSMSQDPCQDLICVTFHDVILLTDLWNYGSGKHWLSFKIISAICMIYMHLSYRWFSDLLYHVFTAIFVVCIDVLTPVFTLLCISYSFYENSDTFRCNKMHIYHAYCRNNFKRQSVFTRPIVS